jgi:hypothetical protein
VPFCGNWYLEKCFTRVGVRTNGGNAQEEWFTGSNGVAEELQGSIGNNIGGVLSGNTAVHIFVQSHDAIKVAVGAGVNQD